MDELLDVFELDLGELVAGGLQLVLAAVLVVLGLGLMVASLVIDGVFLWGVIALVLGIVVGLVGVFSLFEGVF